MLRVPFRACLALLALVPAASATWSIVCVNARTGEVGVASATCLANFNLRQAVPVVVVGRGAAAAQSFIDLSGENKRLIYESFRDTDLTPQVILDLLEAQDGQHQTRQYGIVSFTGDPVTFTGRRDGAAATGVVGRVGDYVYSIQGNVLTGDQVVFAAEVAFRGTKGDMGQRIMAAMHAARALGGDGRCSCSGADPTGCGVPPPNFTKSAHVGVLIVARMGDTDNGCNPNQGCARGSYYLNRNIRSGVNALDPVLQLQGQYDDWRKNLLERPDGVLSEVAAPATIPADGVSRRTVEVRLRDVDDHVLDHAEAIVEVRVQEADARSIRVGPVENAGSGRYRFTVTAPAEVREDTLVITATHTRRDDPADTITATLYPYVTIASVPAPLRVGSRPPSVGTPADLTFTLDLPEFPGAAYRLVARMRSPLGAGGPAVGLLPIATSPFFPAAPGHLDAAGHAEASLSVPPDAWTSWPGGTLEVHAYVRDGGWRSVRAPVLLAPDVDGIRSLPR